MKAAPEPSLYNIDQFICCVAGSSRANKSGISYPYHKIERELNRRGLSLWLLKHRSLSAPQAKSCSTKIVRRLTQLKRQHLSYLVPCWDSLCLPSCTIKQS